MNVSQSHIWGMSYRFKNFFVCQISHIRTIRVVEMASMLPALVRTDTKAPPCHLLLTHNMNTTKEVILRTAAYHSNKYTSGFTYNFSSFNLNSSCIIHMLLCVECIGKKAYSVRQIMHSHIEFRKGGTELFIL